MKIEKEKKGGETFNFNEDINFVLFSVIKSILK